MNWVPNPFQVRGKLNDQFVLKLVKEPLLKIFPIAGIFDFFLRSLVQTILEFILLNSSGTSSDYGSWEVKKGNVYLANSFKNHNWFMAKFLLHLSISLLQG